MQVKAIENFSVIEKDKVYEITERFGDAVRIEDSWWCFKHFKEVENGFVSNPENVLVG